MRAKILFLLLWLAFLAMNVNSTQLRADATLREIQLKATPRLSPRSMKTASLIPSIIKETAPVTHLVGNVLAVNFAFSISNVSVVVTRAETGEVVHHKLLSYSAPTILFVQLDGCYSGLYYINITTSSTVYRGEFVL